MAGRTHELSLGTVERLQPWPVVIEVARALPDGWILVGGLMVRLHEIRAGLAPTRATRDVDMVVDITASTLSDIGRALVGLGFEPDLNTSHIYRFRRGDDEVDAMIPDHQPATVVKSPAVRFLRKTGFEVDAGTQALRRSDRFEIATAAGDVVVVHAPDAIGALVLKGAAHIVDSRDPDRHLEDAAVLLAGLGSVRHLDRASFTKNDRRRLRHLDDLLRHPGHEAWSILPDSEREEGLDRLTFLRRAADL